MKQEDIRRRRGGFTRRGRDRDADVRRGERGRVVDPIANHRNLLVLFTRVTLRRLARGFHNAKLISRGQPGADFIAR